MLALLAPLLEEWRERARTPARRQARQRTIPRDVAAELPQVAGNPHRITTKEPCSRRKFQRVRSNGRRHQPPPVSLALRATVSLTASGDNHEHWRRRASGSAIILRMVGLRWDGDERGEGVADATGFVAGVFELVDAMRSPSWVAEEPGVHLLPHIERACRTLLLEVEDARLSADGSFDVRLSWTGQRWRVGEIRAAVFALVGSLPRSRRTSGSVG